MAKKDPYASWLKDITSGSYSMNPFDFASEGAKNDAVAAFKSATDHGDGGKAWYKKVGSGLKHAGHTSLKALSVPQAAVFTGLRKYMHAIAPEAVDDMSWKNAGGAFYKNYRGGADVLKDFGVEGEAAQKWGGLGLDFVADPLWFLAPAKIAKTGGTIAKLAGEGEKSLAVLDKAKVLDNAGKAVETAVTRHVQDAAGVPANWALRFGTKKHGVNIPTGIKAKHGLVDPKKGFKAGKILQTKVQKAGHAATRTVEETAGHNRRMIERAAEKEFNLTPNDRTVLGVVSGAKSYDDYAALIKAAHDSGQWSPKLDDALEWIETKYKTYGAERGHRGFLAHAADQADLAANFDAKAADASLSASERAAARKAATEARLEAGRLADTAPFSHHTTSMSAQDEWTKMMQSMADKGLSGQKVASKKGMSSTGGRIDKSRKRDSMFAGTTPEQFAKDLAAAGVDKRFIDAVTKMDLGWGKTLARMKDTPVVASPDWDAISRLAHYSDQHIRGTGYAALEKQLLERGVPKDSDVFRAVMENARTAADPASLMSSKAGRNYQKAVATQKGIYTTINPGHFTGNLSGDFINSLMRGNRRHLLPSALPGSTTWKLGKLNEKALAKTHKVAGKEMSGAEILANAHLAGIGKGFIGGEVAGHAPKWMESGKLNPARFMGQLNNRREDAQRVGTWLKHMKGGEDIFSAGAKTVGSHFDYKALTPMEQKYMRNAFLFYTWMRKNAELQAKGLVLRPKIAKTINVDFERAREKYPNEPDYFSKLGALPTPWGSVNFRSPTSDIFKFDASEDGFSQGILAAGNPAWRVPMEWAMNRQSFSGAPIESYEGQMKASPFAWVANKFGADNMYLPYSGATEAAPSMPAKWAYVLSQLTGPYGGLAASQTAPASEKNSMVDLISRLSGMGVLQNEPVKFYRSKVAQERKKKADATRRNNLKVRG